MASAFLALYFRVENIIEIEYYKGMKRITVNVRSFEDLRTRGDYIYVDKTEYVYRLVQSELENYYFISRPRRYGKSLMCSTLASLFEGKRELFKGLYIDSTDYSFERYPVLHFNFAEYSTTSYEAFLNDFQIAIIDNAELNGIKIKKSEPSSMLTSFLTKVEKKTVIIIDEYDTPIIHTYKNLELADKIRDTLSTFYSVIKNRDDKVRFFFITGITKFSNMSIFSQMNNLTDLTFSPNYAAAFGYTEKELEANFSEYIDEYMSRSDREYEKREDFVSAIREYYDGYKFSYESNIKVFNPVSVGSFFNGECRFKNYWMETGGASTLAVELAREYNLETIILDNVELDVNSISSFDYLLLAQKKLSQFQILALIYFTGYLTIKEGNINVLTLTFPNTEVKTTFTQFLVQKYSGIVVGFFVNKAEKALKDHNLAQLVKVLNAYYIEHPYTLLEKEKGYQLAFYSFFVMMGAKAMRAEETTLLGRSDVVLETKNDVYVIELKRDKTAQEALEQVKTMGYHEKYVNTDKIIHIIGLNCISDKRQINEWVEEIVDKTKEPNYLG